MFGVAALVSVPGAAFHASADGDTETTVDGVPGTSPVVEVSDVPPPSHRRPWTSIGNWVYWLDGPDPQEIGASGYELAVIDYSANGTADGEFTASEIEQLRHATCERRVVAYVSIGEAEDYRFYWDPSWKWTPPSWLQSENAAWRGNYRVRYWDPAWQGLVYRYLDRVIAQGFDGVYLDRVDAYREPYARGREQEMVNFVQDLAAYARSRSLLREDFGVIIQNAEELATTNPALLAAVDGIGREETYVEATDAPTSMSEQADVEKLLDVFRARSRSGLVLTVDYASRPELTATAYAASRARGYVPYVADVALDRLRINPGYEPVCGS